MKRPPLPSPDAIVRGVGLPCDQSAAEVLVQGWNELVHVINEHIEEVPIEVLNALDQVTERYMSRDQKAA